MKTGYVALVLCLNISVDPPDVIKISPCARMECWTGALLRFWFAIVFYLLHRYCLLYNNYILCLMVFWLFYFCGLFIHHSQLECSTLNAFVWFSNDLTGIWFVDYSTDLWFNNFFKLYLPFSKGVTLSLFFLFFMFG